MFSIVPIAAFTDNYIWVLEIKGEDLCYVVDPGDAQPVLDYMKAHNKRIEGILITHHHYDHVGGVQLLQQQYPQACIYGPKQSPFKGIQYPLEAGDSLPIRGYNFKILQIPGHTLDHIAYQCSEAAILFCGDTLFAAGCGRLFEGTAEQMYRSLMQLKALDPRTKVYCAHEYTVANLLFAQRVEPFNNQIKERLQYCQVQRAANKPTLPSTIADELVTNPFLRAADVKEFATRRHWKDTL